ncbi:MAG: hypothetical protein HQK93_05650 [Nitrospirae bacterium]|nr:hypothetical protein [Nitrospirota bacterium]
MDNDNTNTNVTNTPTNVSSIGVQGNITGTDVSPTTIVSGNDNKVNISSIIEDNSGGLSSTRVLMLAWGLGTLLVWSICSVIGAIHGIYIFPSIPDSVVTILGIVLGGKVVQRFGEK